MPSVIRKIKQYMFDCRKNIAITHNDQTFTYQDLENHSNKIAGFLSTLNIKENANVAFLMRRSFDMLATILAIWKQGATYIPLDPKTPNERIENILNNIDTPYILTDPALLNKITSKNYPVITLRDLEFINCNKTQSWLTETLDNHLGYIIYTSGSTGEPKGVMLTHSNIENHINWLIQDFGFSSNDCFSFNSSMAFDFSVACTLLPLTVGAKIVITSEEDTLDIETYCKQLVENKVTFVKWTPSYFKLIVDYVEKNRPDLSSFRYLMTGGEELLTSYVERWLAIYPNHNIINEYGPTEAAVGITTQLITKDSLDKSLHSIPIGKKAINTTLYIVDKQNNPVKSGEMGELLIGGTSVARGYYKQPELTNERFIELPYFQGKLYKTGDLVKQLPDDSYLYVSRIDNQVKVNGYRIELNEIEHWILQYSGVKHAKVVIDKQLETSPKITAYLVQQDTINFDDLRIYLSRFLPQFMLPSRFIPVSHIPCNRNGKVDLQALKKYIIISKAEDDSTFPENHFLVLIIKSLEKYIEINKTDYNNSFFSLGVNSLLAAQLVIDINNCLDHQIKVQDLFSNPSPYALANYLNYREKSIDELNLFFSVPENSFQQEPIAIIAMDCRLPGANDCESLWKLCQEGKEAISFFDPVEKGLANNSDSAYQVYARGILSDIEYFDADFFNFSPKEAHLSDPQHRLLIESSWIALEKAGYIPNPHDLHKTGIYVSMNDSTYMLNHNVIEILKPIFEDKFAMQRLMSPQCLATKIAYSLNCTGPSITIQTACSSSLVSIVLACQQLSDRHCNIAIAGGISILTPQASPYQYQKGNIFSPDGHCRPFDQHAEGTVFSNGLGVVVLKRLSDALRDNDTIISVIRGTATNNDGNNKMSFTAPNIDGQMKCILSAQHAASIDPNTIQYIETHGTGTLIGDPIEIEALSKAFQMTGKKPQICALGSLKANIGHTHVAAGVAGLIKTSLALQHKQIPPSINFEKGNPSVDWENSPFYVNKRLQYWEKKITPRRAAVSAFGVGGTNAHVILEEALEAKPNSTDKNNFILLLSAKTEEALRQMHDNLISYFENAIHHHYQKTILADAAYTLQIGRKNFQYRSGVVCNNMTSAITVLKHNRDLPATEIDLNQIEKPKLVFLFPGQGTQYINLSLILYQKEPIYRNYLDECLAIGNSYVNCDLKSILFQSNLNEIESEPKINQTEYTHPILFAVEYSLAKFLIDYGVQPDFMLGHSLGEYVAACISGVFSLNDALQLVCARGKAISQCSEGNMLVAPLSLEDASLYCSDEIFIGAINANDRLVFSGTKNAIAKLYQKLLDTLSVPEKSILEILSGSYSFHCKLLQSAIKPFKDTLKTISINEPKIPFLSNFTGTWIKKSDVIQSDYWVDHLLNTVKFSECANQILQKNNTLFLELGPGQGLLSLLQRHSKKPINAISLLPSAKAQSAKSDNHFIEEAIKTLWCNNISIRWSKYYELETRRRIPLPTYPFQKKRYWFDEIVSPKESERLNLTNNQSLFYVPTWRREPSPLQNSLSSFKGKKRCWIIFANNSKLSLHTDSLLKDSGELVFTVRKGKNYKKLNQYSFIINPRSKSDYTSVVQEITQDDVYHYSIVHFWSTNQTKTINIQNLVEHPILYDGFYSGLFISQTFNTLKSNITLSAVMITTELHKVLGNESIQPLKTGILSLCRVLSLENKNYRFNSIDVDNDSNNIALYANNICQIALFYLNSIKPHEPKIIAFRYQYLWNLIYKKVNESNAQQKSKFTITPKATYLITGGLGAMGLTIANLISKQAPATLVLLSRTPFPPQEQWEPLLKSSVPQDPISKKIKAILSIIERGVKVIILAGDIANFDQMKDLIKTTEKKYGKIKGILHLAGIPGEGLSLLKNKEQITSVLAPKIQGLWVLSKLFGHTKLDFMICASSLTAIVGGIGQIDYCMANLFIDAFLSQKTFKNCKRLLTINWNSWSSIGMATNLLHSKTHEKLYSGNSITPQHAILLFEKAFQSKYEQIIISHLSPKLERNRIIAAFDKPQKNLQQFNTAPKNNNYSNIKDRLISIWQKILGIKEINETDTFYSLGGDSLLAVQLLLALENEFGIDFSLQELAHAHTLHSLENLIKTHSLRSNEEIIPLLKQKKHNNESIYFIHPLGGTIFCYFPLIPYLNQDYAYYGIQDPELAKKKTLFHSIKEMSEYYAKIIKLKQDKGNIILIGSSFGGNLSIEMSTSLKSMGIRVKKIILIDSWANLSNQIFPFENENLELSKLSESMKVMKDFYGIESHQYQTIKKRLNWLRTYTPSTIDTETVLFKAKNILPIYQQIDCSHNGWDYYCSSNISKYTIQGNHDTMLNSDNLPSLGEQINAVINDKINKD